MSYKFLLTLRADFSPHLYLSTIKQWIEKDNYLLPQMRKTLKLLKQFNRSFVQLPLQMEVIVSPENNCNLERSLSPTLLAFNKTLWDDKDIEKYKKDKSKFIHEIKELYTKMGYDIEQMTISEDLVKSLVIEVDKKLEKFGAKGLLDKIK